MNIKKKLVLFSNCVNHYSRSIAEAFVNIYGDDFKFIATPPLSKMRKALGFRELDQEPFILRTYDGPEALSQAQKMIDEAECVITGGLPVNSVSSRLSQNKLTFIQSERFFKGPFFKKDLGRFVKYCLYSGGRRAARDMKAKFYLMCVSAFAAWDYNTCGLFRNKAYRWGYFPELLHYDDVDGLISRKKPASILWVGRFLDWKHPELAVKLAKNLRDSGVNFSLKIIGSGNMLDSLVNMIDSLGLNDYVELPTRGGVSPEEVRRYMESSQIFIFTSDRGEGWGVVLNEAMNSACAVIAGEKIGSAPYLIQNDKNGLIFKNKNLDDLTLKVKTLLENPSRIHELGRAAYESMITLWNPKTAATRFVTLSQALNDNTGPVNLFSDGPCSIAPVV